MDLARRLLSVTQAATEVNGATVGGLPKNHQIRSVPVATSLVELLVHRCEGRAPEDLVFTGSRGNIIRNNDWNRRVFGAALHDPGLGHLTPHGLRHTAARLDGAVGANVMAAQRMLGHASAAVTQGVYAGLFDQDLDGLADRLDGPAGVPSVRDEPQVGLTAATPPRLRRCRLSQSVTAGGSPYMLGSTSSLHSGLFEDHDRRTSSGHPSPRR